MENPDNRALLLRTAVDLISRFGYDAVTLRQISKEAGLEADAIYAQFASKEDLLTGVLAYLEEHLQVFTLSPSEINRRLRDQTPAEILRSYVAFYKEHSDSVRMALYRILYMGMYRDQRICDATYRIIIAEPIENMTAALDHMARIGVIPPGDSRALAELWTRTSIVYGYQAAHDYDKVDWGMYFAMTEFFIEMAVRGVKPVPLEHVDLQWNLPRLLSEDGASGSGASMQILLTALDLFSQYGYSSVTVREIAEKAGVRPGAVYELFPGKREILRSLIHIFLDGFRQYSEDNPAFRSVLESKDPQRITLSLSSSYPPTQKALVYKIYRVLFQEQYLNDDLQQYFMESIREDCTAITGLIDDLIRQGRVRPCESKKVATAYVHAMCSFTVGGTVDLPVFEEPLRSRTIALLVGFLIGGYLS